MSKTELIEKMRKEGYPYKIKGNGGYIRNGGLRNGS